MKWLVFVQIGGDMESSGRCGYMYYTICSGNTEMEALQDWTKQNNINSNFYKNNEQWVDRGYILQIIPLYEYVPDKKLWQKLKWT